jgi:hypothetical protein
MRSPGRPQARWCRPRWCRVACEVAAFGQRERERQLDGRLAARRRLGLGRPLVAAVDLGKHVGVQGLLEGDERVTLAFEIARQPELQRVEQGLVAGQDRGAARRGEVAFDQRRDGLNRSVADRDLHLVGPRPWGVGSREERRVSRRVELIPHHLLDQAGAQRRVGHRQAGEGVIGGQRGRDRVVAELPADLVRGDASEHVGRFACDLDVLGRALRDVGVVLVGADNLIHVTRPGDIR